MSREQVQRGSLTSLRRSSLVSSVFESATSKIFPLEPDIDFDSPRRSPERKVGGGGCGGGGGGISAAQEPLMGRVGPSRNLEGKTRVHQKR